MRGVPVTRDLWDGGTVGEKMGLLLGLGLAGRSMELLRPQNLDERFSPGRYLRPSPPMRRNPVGVVYETLTSSRFRGEWKSLDSRSPEVRTHTGLERLNHRENDNCNHQNGRNFVEQPE